MKDVIIVSGGNIQRDFALDFLKKNKTEKVDPVDECLIEDKRAVSFPVSESEDRNQGTDSPIPSPVQPLLYFFLLPAFLSTLYYS